MFKAIVSADTLRATLDSVGVLVEECRVNLDEEGLSIQAVDPANVGMVHLHLAADAFEAYEADGELLGVDLGRLEEIAGMAESGQLIELELQEETRKLRVAIDGLEYTVALLDPEAVREGSGEPDLELPTEVVLEGADVDRAVRAAGMVSDHVTFGVDPDAEVFYVEAAGDTDDVNLQLGREELIDLVVHDEPGAVESLYSLEYLDEITRAVPGDAEVTLELGEEFPLKMGFQIAEGRGDVLYVLAPRIQTS
ncbi:MAG: DNA polymerase sliding clamp [Halobacteriaceae archaeon]